MKKIWIALCLAITLIEAKDFTKIYDMNEVLPYVKDSSEETYVLFDMDMVLIQFKEPAYQMVNLIRYKPIFKSITSEFSKDDVIVLFSLINIKNTPVLLDQHTLNLLDHLEKNNIHAMGLTANLTGPFMSIKCMEKHKIEQLRSLGIEFSHLAPYKNDLVLNEIPFYRGSPTLFTDGILFTNGWKITKGEALVNFLKETGLKPKKIVFLDDMEKNLESVEASLKDSGIEYIPLQYLGSERYPTEFITEETFTAKWRELADEVHALEPQLR